MKRIILLLASALAASCNVDAAEVGCPDGGAGLVLHMPPIEPAKPLITDLTVTGTIDRPPGIAIYNVFVAGVAATSAGVDFDGFTAVVPYATLVSLAAADPGSASAQAEIEITARTNCGGTPISLKKVSVPVSLGVQVTRLAFDTPLFPVGASYLPADQSASAILRLRANPGAAGAMVALTATTGTLDGVGVTETLTLSGDGKSDAVAMCTFKSASSAQITAAAPGSSAAMAINVAGPPVISPSSATLAPGEALGISVLTDGKVRWCQATPAVGIHVLSGTADIMTAPAATDVNSDGNVDLTVTIDTPLAADATTTVSCVDLFGQFTKGTFIAKH